MARSRARLRFKLLETTAQGEGKRFDSDLRSEERLSHQIVATVANHLCARVEVALSGDKDHRSGAVGNGVANS